MQPWRLPWSLSLSGVRKLGPEDTPSFPVGTGNMPIGTLPSQNTGRGFELERLWLAVIIKPKVVQEHHAASPSHVVGCIWLAEVLQVPYCARAAGSQFLTQNLQMSSD